MLTVQEIRQRFLDFYTSQDHTLVASSPLVPGNDPTLLFTNAGMVQFKDFFSGAAPAPYPRAVSCQRCVRAGGKHNDLENVGFTARHHTFFEMLGNFSFGDYFKKGAIESAWKFLTSELGLSKDELVVSIFAGDDELPGDEEAFDLWHNTIGIPKERIFRMGRKDNFWSMGDTGPCGPCTEIHFVKKPWPEDINEDNWDDYFLEIWNLVFMQFERHQDGRLTDLPAPCIDTGMGLERVSALLQGKRNNYHTDLFQSIIDTISAGVQKEYGENSEDDSAMHVIADHARATAFLITDGVLPGNEGRNYVLRRIMRRAIRFGDKLGYKDLFFYRICLRVIDVMKDAYPELEENRKAILESVQEEEKRFRKTLARGLNLLEGELVEMREKGVTELPGSSAFTLYDTYGFPVDLTRLICAEAQFSVDEDGFEREMNEQRERSRASWKTGTTGSTEAYQSLLEEVGPSTFLGYDSVETQATVLALAVEGQRVPEVSGGQQVEVVLNQTPAYGESGGQVGDVGVLTTSNGARLRLTDTQKPVPDLFVHLATVEEGTLAVGDEVSVQVDDVRRLHIRRNHSATHLLHYALRQHLGKHIKQAGSLVDSERLRFDFSHYAAIEPDTLKAIEDTVNELVRQDDPTVTRVVSIEEAKAAGAMALFGEKYGDTVRMVEIGPTLELCGGIHVARSGEIGQLRLTSEQGVAAGVRRIEAVTGEGADSLTRFWQESLQEASAKLRCRPDEVSDRIDKLQAQLKELQREVEALKVKAAQGGSSGGDILDNVKEVEGIKVLATQVSLGDPKAMRNLADQLRDRLGSGVVVLIGEHKDKASLIASVTSDLKGQLHAGNLVKALAATLGGRGGGRPDFAQGGGPELGKINDALESVPTLVASQLQG